LQRLVDCRRGNGMDARINVDGEMKSRRRNWGSDDPGDLRLSESGLAVETKTFCANPFTNLTSSPSRMNNPDIDIRGNTWVARHHVHSTNGRYIFRQHTESYRIVVRTLKQYLDQSLSLHWHHQWDLFRKAFRHLRVLCRGRMEVEKEYRS
jgi:hypothetical protein